MARVRVPQESGDVIVATGASVLVNAQVEDHIAEVTDEEAAALLQHVPGAELAPEPTHKAPSTAAASKSDAATS